MVGTRSDFNWTVSAKVLSPGKAGAFDDVAVKDPSIIFDGRAYQLFYTSKGERTTSGYPATTTSLGYVTAESLDELSTAERVDLNEAGRLCDRAICAPQVLHLDGQGLWYLIAHVPIDAKMGVLPVFLTNHDVSDPEGWSKPEPLTFQKRMEAFWIDFWIIADDADKIHLFYTDHDGRMFRQETSVQDFPRGFGTEQEVAFVRGHDDIGPWRLHEASHIYRLPNGGGYLALLEATRPHPLNPAYWDSRTRFMFAMHADSLDGKWRRLEKNDSDFWGDPRKLYMPDGTPSGYGQVSHPEALRSGVNEKLCVDGITPRTLIQAFDASSIDDHFRYDFLPWEIALIEPRP